MADGRILDSIEGFIVPSTGKAESAYRILKKSYAIDREKNISSSDKVGVHEG